MPELFSIEHETLRASADKIRGILSENHYTFDPSIFGENGGVPDGSIILRYSEFIDFDGTHIVEYNTLEPVIDLGFLPNNRGEIVPVLYVNDYLTFPDKVGYEDKLFYEGTVEINGETCDKWRKIEIDVNYGDDLDWDADEQIYYYTNVIILKSNEISPLEFPQKIDEVYEAGEQYVFDIANAELTGNEFPPAENADGLGEAIDNAIGQSYDKGYKSGYDKGNNLYYVTTLQSLFKSVTFPENFEMVAKLKSVTNIATSFMGAQNIKSITLISEDKNSLIDAASAFRECRQLETVDLTEFNRTFSSVGFFLFQSSSLKVILGDLDVSNCTVFPNSTFEAASLEEIRFVAGTINVTITFYRCSNLSKASITSIINGLSTTVSGQTLTLSKASVENAFGSTTSTEWTTLIGTRSNWSISLI